MNACRLALLVLIASSAPASASEATGAPPDTTGAGAAEARLADLAWLAGSWRGTAGAHRQEEHWTSAANGLMLGLHRDLGPEGRVAFEYLRIEQRPEGVVYLASPGGAEPTPFRLVEASATRAVFANPEHDFPKRIVYTRVGDALTARVEGDGGRGMDFVWTRSEFLAEQEH